MTCEVDKSNYLRLSKIVLLKPIVDETVAARVGQTVSNDRGRVG